MASEGDAIDGAGEGEVAHDAGIDDGKVGGGESDGSGFIFWQASNGERGRRRQSGLGGRGKNGSDGRSADFAKSLVKGAQESG